MSVKLPDTDVFSRAAVVAVMNLWPGEKRGYWKTHTPGTFFSQTKVVGKVDDNRAILMFDSGAEVSLMDTTFARKVGCVIDETMTKDCLGVGDTPYETLGRAMIKITLAGNLVYRFNVWVGDLPGQNVLLGMDFVVPAGIRVDAGDGSICLPDEVRIRMLGRRELFSTKRRQVCPSTPLWIEVGQSCDVPMRPDHKANQQLWVSRGKGWTPTVLENRGGKPRYIRLTNISDRPVTVGTLNKLGVWIGDNVVPRDYGFVTTKSNRYAEWQNLVFGATREFDGTPIVEEDKSPSVQRVEYPTPTAILSRTSAEDDLNLKEAEDSPRVPIVAAVEDRDSPSQQQAEYTFAEGAPLPDVSQESVQNCSASETPEPPSVPADSTSTPIDEDVVCYHEESDLFAEDVEQEMAVLPEVLMSLTQEVKIEDLKVGMADNVPSKIGIREPEQLRRIIWKKKHLMKFQ